MVSDGRDSFICVGRVPTGSLGLLVSEGTQRSHLEDSCRFPAQGGVFSFLSNTPSPLVSTLFGVVPVGVLTGGRGPWF